MSQCGEEKKGDTCHTKLKRLCDNKKNWGRTWARGESYHFLIPQR